MLSLNKFLLVVFLVLSAVHVYGSNNKGGPSPSPSPPPKSGPTTAIAKSESIVSNGQAQTTTFTQTTGQGAQAQAFAQAIIKAGGCDIDVTSQSQVSSITEYITKNCDAAIAKAYADAVAQGEVQTFAQAFTFTEAKGCDLTAFAQASGKCTGLRK
eukprot:TRINITY_DN6784_c0_g5_i2.p1 TRINITY_DN6784_c0_g5~~TRINITY_DN6784_c0_g5_i2.p1  ORF type:complete len:156 (-),score=25.37 TRINITY_DN6784_c0_g5_i2:275-742(-)